MPMSSMSMPYLARVETGWLVAIHELKRAYGPLHSPPSRSQGQAVSSRSMPRANNHTDQPM
jgi:hypothetical protein